MGALNDWREVRLEDVCERITVGHVGSMANEYVSEGIPFLRSQNITPFKVDLRDVKYITSEFNEKLKKSALRPGDVAVVRTGYPGTAAVIPRALMVSNCSDLVIIRPGEEIDSWFLSCLFNSVWGKNMVAGNLVGVAQQHFNVGAAKNLRIRLPPIQIQQTIASILRNYDDLIENNTRRIEILEEMARRLYEEWFVQFRFPGHEGVEFKESELGLIPEGWKVVALETAVEINPKTKVERDGEKVFVPMGALSETGMVISGWEIKSGNSGAKFQNGDTLVARISPCLENGKTGFVDFLPANQPTACGSTEFIVLRSRSLCPEMVYCLSRSDRFREVAMKSMSGATGRQRVRVESLLGYPIAQPENELVAKYHAFAQPCFKEIRVLANKNANLRQQRDLLLPKLISGEIDVSDIPMPT
ncbi:restriction endonuclease subunit S [Pseudomonas phenolilytica]|uniref:restriction endonuclease subunit S n=1 Tax=Pseudomonas phenolilytica TaxID=2746321 RepID=UPI001F2FBE10|nr:restriction endonuclease subunit S [Pseudomonas phenolilytica]UIP88247.1 restriction endonuclease subunit S [Pseudomonas phenolilytica]